MPTTVYLAALALVKVSYLVYAVFMFAVVGLELARHRKWRAAVPALAFASCYLVAWCLLGQRLSDLPLYFRGSLDLLSGFSQAMSLPPDPAVLRLSLVMAVGTIVQLALLFASGPRPRRLHLPLVGLLTGGVFLAWRAGFARADGHVFDWLVYAMVSGAAAPAFLRPIGRPALRWAERGCVAGVLVAGTFCIARLDPGKGAQLATMFQERWSSNLRAVTHPLQVARDSRNVVLQSRAANALPQVRQVVGQDTVDVFCDEEAIAILNGLNYRPRPCFLNYSTYTPWLVDLNLAFYCSPRGPAYVLFKLESIDNRLPTLQNAPLLIVLETFYAPVLTENGWVLFHRREQPRMSGTPAAFPLLTQGDFSLADTLTLPAGGPVWCELELHETLAGKLLKFFYQQPALNLAVSYDDGRAGTYRLIPRLTSSGFLINPLPFDAAEFTRWLAGQPLPVVRSIRVVPPASAPAIFAPRAHYRFYRVPAPRP